MSINSMPQKISDHYVGVVSDHNPLALRGPGEGTEEFLGRGTCGCRCSLRRRTREHRPSIGVWCSLRAVTSNGNQVSPKHLVATRHRFFRGGSPPRAVHPSGLLTPEA